MTCEAWGAYARCSMSLASCPLGILFLHTAYMSTSKISLLGCSITAPQLLTAGDASHVSLVPRLLFFINASRALLGSNGLIVKKILSGKFLELLIFVVCIYLFFACLLPMNRTFSESHKKIVHNDNY